MSECTELILIFTLGLPLPSLPQECPSQPEAALNSGFEETCTLHPVVEATEGVPGPAKEVAVDETKSAVLENQKAAKCEIAEESLSGCASFRAPRDAAEQSRDIIPQAD